MKFHADIHVTLKPLVNDPAGLVIRDGLKNLGFGEVDSARTGKYLQLEVDADGIAGARARVQEMCQKLLANPVIEEFEFDVRKVTSAPR